MKIIQILHCLFGISVVKISSEVKIALCCAYLYVGSTFGRMEIPYILCCSALGKIGLLQIK